MAQIRYLKMAVLFLLLITISLSSQASIQEPDWDLQEREGRNSLEDDFEDDDEESYSRQDFPDEEKLEEHVNDGEADNYDGKDDAEDNLDEEENVEEEDAYALSREVSREVDDEKGWHAENRESFTDDDEIADAGYVRSEYLPEENSNLDQEISELKSASDKVTQQIKDLLESFDSMDTGLSDDAEVAQDAGHQEKYYFAFQ